MGEESAAPQPVSTFPHLAWGRPTSRVDMSAVKPHVCMQNVVQIGNYIHCHNGHHGMRIPANKILVKVGDSFELQDIVVRESPNPDIAPQA